MAPRKTRSSVKEETSGDRLQELKEAQDRTAHEDVKESTSNEKLAAVGDKRKKSSLSDTANKAPRATKSDQATTTHEQEGATIKPSPEQILRFLLSEAALEVCRPEDELEDLSKRGKDITTYAQLLSPFEELLCAVVLSRPISHRLGLRTIRTILNSPYELKDADIIKAAGAERIHQALDDARTQHKGKTTEEIGLIAEAVANNDWQNDLERIREQNNNAVDEEREVLRSSIKGLGKTGLDIFYRRIQWLWHEAFPFVDARTQGSLEKLGLPNKPKEIVELIEKNWQDVEFGDSGEFGDEEMKRRAFVLLLERAMGADLEKRVEDVLVAAVKS